MRRKRTKPKKTYAIQAEADDLFLRVRETDLPNFDNKSLIVVCFNEDDAHPSDTVTDADARKAQAEIRKLVDDVAKRLQRGDDPRAVRKIARKAAAKSRRTLFLSVGKKEFLQSYAKYDLKLERFKGGYTIGTWELSPPDAPTPFLIYGVYCSYL